MDHVPVEGQDQDSSHRISAFDRIPNCRVEIQRSIARVPRDPAPKGHPWQTWQVASLIECLRLSGWLRLFWTLTTSGNPRKLDVPRSSMTQKNLTSIIVNIRSTHTMFIPFTSASYLFAESAKEAVTCILLLSFALRQMHGC